MRTKIKNSIIAGITAAMLLTTTACEGLKASIASIKGELVGNNYNVEFYDNSGEQILSMIGEKIGIAGNIVDEMSINSDGNIVKTKTLSSVIDITIDGHQVEQVGNSVIFASKNLNKLVDFDLPETIQTTGGGTINLIDKTINDYKNYFGTPKVVVISSQLGVPICAYGGSSVYWEVPDDLPKTTYLSIDGNPLYLHRVNYIILDTALVK